MAGTASTRRIQWYPRKCCSRVWCSRDVSEKRYYWGLKVPKPPIPSHHWGLKASKPSGPSLLPPSFSPPAPPPAPPPVDIGGSLSPRLRLVDSQRPPIELALVHLGYRFLGRGPVSEGDEPESLVLLCARFCGEEDDGHPAEGLKLPA